MIEGVEPPIVFKPLASAEICDPITGRFTAMTTSRIGHTATLLSDGKVLLTGGVPTEIYDPVTGTFTITGGMATVRDCTLPPCSTTVRS